MSFCPSKDLHSVYLDNEMPENYKAEYESHLKNCPKCQKEFAEVKALHDLLTSDADSLTPDSYYVDQSFERLMIKMKYKETTSKSVSKINIKPTHFVYGLSAVAAAAVFAMVLPLGLKSGKSNVSVANAGIAFGTGSGNSVSSVPIANNVSLNSGRSVVISGNINDTVLSSVNSVNYGKKTSGTNVSHYSDEMIRNVEVFPPQINNGRTTTIRFTVPVMNAVPVEGEFEVPVYGREIPVTVRFGRY